MIEGVMEELCNQWNIDYNMYGLDLLIKFLPPQNPAKDYMRHKGDIVWNFFP